MKCPKCNSVGQFEVVVAVDVLVDADGKLIRPDQTVAELLPDPLWELDPDRYSRCESCGYEALPSAFSVTPEQAGRDELPREDED
jgi:hypothetical protein